MSVKQLAWCYHFGIITSPMRRSKVGSIITKLVTEVVCHGQWKGKNVQVREKNCVNQKSKILLPIDKKSFGIS